jgi:DNA-binding beta-propeller fold protein YncE
MKTTLTSNWRPLLRAFYPFLIAIAALWAMPRTARAQLYVTQGSTGGIVSKYNATTGALIKAHFITRLNGPTGLAVSGTDLFVAIETGNKVGKYNATTGAAINANFITGLHAPFFGLVLNTSGRRLFVTNTTILTNTVGAYNATTGAPINASLITGLNRPVGLALLGNNLFVVKQETNNGTVGKYNATTGAAINANFITGLITPVGLAVK